MNDDQENGKERDQTGNRGSFSFSKFLVKKQPFLVGTMGSTSLRLTSVSDGTGRTVNFGYDTVAGDLTSFTDPENKAWTYEYDNEHKMTKTKDPLLRTITQNTYDSLARVTEQKSQGDDAKFWK